MFRFKYHLWGFITVLTFGAVWSNLVQAMDLSKPLPKRSAKEVLHYGPSSAFFEQYDLRCSRKLHPSSFSFE